MNTLILNSNSCEKLLDSSWVKESGNHLNSRYLKLEGFAILDRVELNEQSVYEIYKRDELSQINGQFSFLILNYKTKSLIVITDRFSSQPIYYYHSKTSIILSKNIFEIIKKSSNLRSSISKENLFEFIYLQRLLGHKTLSNKIHRFQSATRTTLSLGQDLKTSRYWFPSAKKTDLQFESAAKELARLISNSYNLYTNRFEKVGLLLSGGLDSRAVLGASSDKVKCYTLGPFKNNEYQVAKKLAAIKKLPIEFIKRDDRLYYDKRHESVRLGSGAQNIFHSHFYSLKKLSEIPEIFIHGHGFDYFFQGSYMPQDRVYFAGKSTLHHRLKPISDIANLFLKTLKYRLKYKELMPLIPNSQTLLSSLKQEVQRVLKDSKDLDLENPYDQWEYLNSHDLGSHYTALNLHTINTCAKQRCLAWENDLYDFYWSIPASWRLDAKLFKKALLFLNRDLASYQNANINLPAHWPTKLQSIFYFAGQLLNKMGFKRFGLPSENERSWPNFKKLLSEDERWRKEVFSLQDGQIVKIGLVCPLRLKKLIESFYASPSDQAPLLYTLLTLEYALSEIL